MDEKARDMFCADIFCGEYIGQTGCESLILSIRQAGECSGCNASDVRQEAVLVVFYCRPKYHFLSIEVGVNAIRKNTAAVNVSSLQRCFFIRRCNQYLSESCRLHKTGQKHNLQFADFLL